VEGTIGFLISRWDECGWLAGSRLDWLGCSS
jgi:hypothetical protein